MREERIGNQRLLLGDCLDVMPTLGRFDAVIWDPPWGIGSESPAGRDHTNQIQAGGLRSGHGAGT